MTDDPGAPIFANVVPILRIFDIEKAREFYVDFLGFSVDWEHRFESDLPLYMQISRGTAILHLSEHFGDGGAGVHVRISVTSLKRYVRALNAQNYKNARPGTKHMQWGESTTTIADPFGNRITFFERDDSP